MPGSGESLRLGLRSALPDLARCPRLPDGVSSCRWGTGRKAAAGHRSGTVGATIGPASRTWACAAAAGLCLRDHLAGQQSRARVETTHGQGQALTVVAHHVARAVSSRRHRAVAVAPPHFVHGSGRGAGEPRASLDDARMRLRGVLGTGCCLAWLHADAHLGRSP